MSFARIEDEDERAEAEEERAAAVDDRGRPRADYAAAQLDGVQERLDLYVAVHGGDRPSFAVARAWIKEVGGIKAARELARELAE